MRRSESLRHSLSAAQWSEVDRLCDCYENDWAPQRSAELAAWVQQAPEEIRVALAEELIALDRQLRAAARCAADPPSYAEVRQLAARRSMYVGGATEQSPVDPADSLPTGECGSTDAAASPTLTTSASASIDSALSVSRSFGRMPEHIRPRDPAAEIPAQIGRYRITAYLSGGGQGDVFRGIHPTLNREVVIKWGRCCFGDGVPEVQALLREGRILAQLNHPNLVRVHDLDFHEGCPFLVLDFISGRSLRQWRASGEVSPAQAAQWTAQAARALAEVHRQGLIHLDIKPENVLIDESGQARVVDFGLALMPELWAEPQAPLGCFRGTPAYASPEQARGATQWADARADVFGLGALLYWLLTSRAPYQGDTIDEVLAQAAQCRFDRNALRGVPRPLSEITLRAMRARPEDRYPSAGALADDLEAWLARQSSAFGKRRLLTAAAALALSAAVLTAFVASPLGRQALRRWSAAAAIESPAGESKHRPHPQPSDRAGDPPDHLVEQPAEPPPDAAPRSAESSSGVSPTATPGPAAPSASADSPQSRVPASQPIAVEAPGSAVAGHSNHLAATDRAAPSESPGPIAPEEMETKAMQPENPPPLRWDRQTGLLRLHGEVIRRVRVSQAGNIARILDTFESQQWPKWVDQPLGNEADRKTLFAACNSLNESLDRIRFRVAGNGVEWFFVDRPAPQ